MVDSPAAMGRSCFLQAVSICQDSAGALAVLDAVRDALGQFDPRAPGVSLEEIKAEEISAAASSVVLTTFEMAHELWEQAREMVMDSEPDCGAKVSMSVAAIPLVNTCFEKLRGEFAQGVDKLDKWHAIDEVETLQRHIRDFVDGALEV